MTFKFCWTSLGRVFLRQALGKKHFLIKSEADLDKIVPVKWLVKFHCFLLSLTLILSLVLILFLFLIPLTVFFISYIHCEIEITIYLNTTTLTHCTYDFQTHEWILEIITNDSHSKLTQSVSNLHTNPHSHHPNHPTLAYCDNLQIFIVALIIIK